MKKRYDDYDYLEAYSKALEDLDESSRQRVFGEDHRNMAYRTTTTRCGDERVEVDIYPSFGSRRDMPRTKRRRESRQAQKNLNEKRARRYLIQLACTNFGEKDYWCTLTYDGDHLPDDLKGCQKEFQKWIRKVNRLRKKKGLPGNARYIVITEHTESVRAHHHVLIDGDLSRDELEDLWTCGKRNNFRRIDPDDDFQIEGIARYLGKDPKGRKRWSRSRNLKEPTVTRSYSRFSKRRVERMAMDEELLRERLEKSYPGCRMLDAKIRINDINGGFYIYARMKRRC